MLEAPRDLQIDVWKRLDFIWRCSSYYACCRLASRSDRTAVDLQLFKSCGFHISSCLSGAGLIEWLRLTSKMQWHGWLRKCYMIFKKLVANAQGLSEDGARCE